MFGSDFFKVVQFVVAVMRLMARIFGDESDVKNDDDAFNHNSEGVEKIVKANGNKTPAKNA